MLIHVATGVTENILDFPPGVLIHLMPEAQSAVYALAATAHNVSMLQHYVTDV